VTGAEVDTRPAISWRPPEDVVAGADDGAPRTEPSKRVRSWSRRALAGLVVLAGAGALVWVTMARLTGSVSLFLSPDGGHYLTDAAALTGDGVRPLAHPPAFPLLVAATRGVLSPVGQVQFALGCSLGLLAVSLYVLCRRFTGVAAAIAGAGIGATFPAVGELLAWNGGATLLATAFLVLALAANEWWLDEGRPVGALLTGGAAAAAFLAHPFVAAVAFLCIGARWVVELVARGRPRRITLRRGPFSVAQVGLLALPVLAALPIALPYYTSIEADAGVRFGVPRLGAIWDTLTWGLREQGVLLLLFAVFLVAMLTGGRAAATIGASIGAVYLVVSSATRADPSYRTRVAYLLPVVGAVGAAILWQRFVPPLLARVTPELRRRRLFGVAAAGMAVVVFASLGYLPRIPRAAAFYQRLDRVDVTALGTLAGRPGLVATSWNQNAYGNGVSNAWYVEGLAGRKSAGPTDPALSTIAREQREGAAMQQFFAGVSGVQNGALQLSLGPGGSFMSPAVQAMIAGMYRPVLYVNDAVNAYPQPLGRPSAKEFGDLSDGASVEHHLTADGVDGEYRVPGAPSGADPDVTMSARLMGSRVEFTYAWHGATSGHPLTVRLFPAYGVLWRDLRADTGKLQFVADPFQLTGVTTTGTRGQEVVLRGRDGTRLRYEDRDPQFGLQSVELQAGRDGKASFVMSLPDGPRTDAVQQFDQSRIARQLDVRDVVLWKDTGWETRFDDPNCFTKEEETRRLLVFHMLGSCRARVGTDASAVQTAPGT
jgi:hypothetical protein